MTISIIEAARQIGEDGIFLDPTDAEIVLAAVELARGNWPEGFTVDREFEARIVKAWEEGNQ